MQGNLGELGPVSSRASVQSSVDLAADPAREVAPPCGRSRALVGPISGMIIASFLSCGGIPHKKEVSHGLRVCSDHRF